MYCMYMDSLIMTSTYKNFSNSPSLSRNSSSAAVSFPREEPLSGEVFEQRMNVILTCDQENKMENGTCSNESQGSGSGAGSSGASRWNPTKEQIEILEGMYKAGIRTPTAEQIQHITGRLRAYGHIEGKNVFYWFQNHKARQRQKEKQESLTFLSRYFHQSTRNAAAAGFPSPCPKVICGPCYMPHGDIGFYPIHRIHPKILRPCAVKKRQWSEFNGQESLEPYYNHKVHNHPRLQSQFHESGKAEKCNATPDDCDHVPQRTLDLFPLHPTGIVNGNNPWVNIDAPTGSSRVMDYSSNHQMLQSTFKEQ